MALAFAVGGPEAEINRVKFLAFVIGVFIQLGVEIHLEVFYDLDQPPLFIPVVFLREFFQGRYVESPGAHLDQYMRKPRILP